MITVEEHTLARLRAVAEDYGVPNWPRLSPARLHRDIEAAHRRHADAEAARVSHARAIRMRDAANDWLRIDQQHVIYGG